MKSNAALSVIACSRRHDGPFLDPQVDLFGRGSSLRPSSQSLTVSVAAYGRTSFVEIPRQRGGGRVPLTEAEFTAMRGGLTAEQYRWKFIREFGVE